MGNHNFVPQLVIVSIFQATAVSIKSSPTSCSWNPSNSNNYPQILKLQGPFWFCSWWDSIWQPVGWTMTRPHAQQNSAKIDDSHLPGYRKQQVVTKRILKKWGLHVFYVFQKESAHVSPYVLVCESPLSSRVNTASWSAPPHFIAGSPRPKRARSQCCGPTIHIWDIDS